MNRDDLDRELARLTDARVPDPPGDLRSRVWRSIREAEAQPQRRWMPSFWPEWMARPAFALAFVMVTFGVGVVLGSAQVPEASDLAATTDHGALFDVFDARGPGSPYDRLFHRE